jgi:phage FluMu gp28-like protein
MFYTMVTDGGIPVRKVRRSDAFQQGMKIYHPITRKEISPNEARAASLDKRAYDQNYECIFCDENMALLTLELISAAEAFAGGHDGSAGASPYQAEAAVICDQDWSPEALELLRGVQGQLDLGIDVGRNRDLTVMTAGEKIGDMRFVRAILRCQGMRLPAQQMRLGEVCRIPKFHRAAIDMTGIGLGLCEYAQDEFGQSRIQGVNFGTSVPMPNSIRIEGRRGESVRVTEAMAMALLQCFEDRRIKIPCHPELRDDLRKPEKVVTPGGRVSIAASRTEAGHADHFWSMALMVEAGSNSGPFVFAVLNNQIKSGQRSVWMGSLKGCRPGVLC